MSKRERNMSGTSQHIGVFSIALLANTVCKVYQINFGIVQFLLYPSFTIEVLSYGKLYIKIVSDI